MILLGKWGSGGFSKDPIAYGWTFRARAEGLEARFQAALAGVASEGEAGAEEPGTVVTASAAALNGSLSAQDAYAS